MTTPRLFRFGASIFQTTSGREWADKARRVEASGFSTLLMADHIAGSLAFAPALTAAAAVTTSLRLGTFTIDNDFRHPALVAKDAATIDLLSDGRFELGIGAGWLREDYEQIGLDFDPPGVRVSRLEESLRLMKALFVEESVEFAGQHYTVTNLCSYPKPVQRPYPPILIGAGGKRLLSLAAREADIISIAPSALPGGGLLIADAAPSAIAQKAAWVRDAAGDRYASLELNVLIQRLVVTDSPQSAADELSGPFSLPPEQVLQSPLFLIGTIDEIADTLRHRRDEYGFSYITVFERDMEAFAPIVARLAGT